MAAGPTLGTFGTRWSVASRGPWSGTSRTHGFGPPAGRQTTWWPTISGSRWRVLQRPDLAAIGEARHWFQQAVATDPHFARAYVGLAMTHLNEWACFTWNHWVFPKEEVLAQARRAVELDDHDQRAHCVLGMTELYARDYEVARPRLLKALELNPNDTDVLAHAAVGMALLGEHDLAVEVGRRALRLAPHGPEWHAAFVGEGFLPLVCTRKQSKRWRRHQKLCATRLPFSPRRMPTWARWSCAPGT